MRLAVISDIHGNLPALEVVMASMHTEGVDQVVCLGDIVGYGARPNECISLIQDGKIPCVLGNHDEAAIGAGDIDNFNPWAKEAINWTAEKLDRSSRQFLSELKLSLETEEVFFVHATPNEPGAWYYLFSAIEAHHSFNAFKQQVCFIGHSHIPGIFTETNGKKRIINVGSVGQPRDRDPRTCWGLYDTVIGDFKCIRAEYQYEKAKQQILDEKLPQFLAYRLLSGT